MGVTPQPATPEHYRELLRSLLPRSTWSIWQHLSERADGVLLALGDELSRVHNALLSVLDEMDPRTATPASAGGLLDDWERVAGLPDPDDASPPAATVDRQAALVAKLRATGGQSPGYYVEVAAGLGIAITVHEFDWPPFRCGAGRCGDRLYGEPWAFYWEIEHAGPASTTLAALMQRLKPAHTVLGFEVV